MQGEDLGAFWDARAREDALYFVDNDQPYKAADVEAFWRGGEEVVDGLWRRLDAPAIDPAARVLDLGCGVGRLTRALAARVPEGEVVGLDVSAAMLERAREENAHLRNASFVQGDGATLGGLGDASFDLAVSFVVFQHLPDPRMTLRYVSELGCVLRPGGEALFQVSNDPRAHVRHPPPRERLKTLVGRAPRGQLDERWLGSAVGVEPLHATALEAGLAIVRMEGAGTQFCLVRAVKER